MTTGCAASLKSRPMGTLDVTLSIHFRIYVHNTAGYSFPFLQDCNADREEDLTIPSTFAVVKFTQRQVPFFFLFEPQRADEVLGILERIWGRLKIQEAGTALHFFF